MNHDVTKPQVCLLLKNGIQFWMEKDRAKLLRASLEPNVHTGRAPEFVDLIDEEASFMRIEISGFYTPEQMDEITRRKNGQWMCKEGYWHDRGEKCEDCWVKNAQKRAEEHRRAHNLGEYADT